MLPLWFILEMMSDYVSCVASTPVQQQSSSTSVWFVGFNWQLVGPRQCKVQYYKYKRNEVASRLELMSIREKEAHITTFFPAEIRLENFRLLLFENMFLHLLALHARQTLQTYHSTPCIIRSRTCLKIVDEMISNKEIICLTVTLLRLHGVEIQRKLQAAVLSSKQYSTKLNRHNTQMDFLVVASAI